MRPKSKNYNGLGLTLCHSCLSPFLIPQLEAELKATATEYKQTRGLYNPSGPNSVGKATHSTYGPIYKQSDGTWWAKDKAGHAGVTWKVFRQEKDGLVWIKDATEFGDYVTGKHKSPVDVFIPKSHLGSISGW